MHISTTENRLGTHNDFSDRFFTESEKNIEAAHTHWDKIKIFCPKKVTIF